MLSAAGLSAGTTGTEKAKPLSLAPPPVASTKTRTAGTENLKPLSLAPPPSASGKIRSPLPPPPNDPAAVRMTSTSQNAAVKGQNDTARRSTDAFTDFSQLEVSLSLSFLCDILPILIPALINLFLVSIACQLTKSFLRLWHC